ncbi:hypothetical protein [Butyrivibrio sp. INlla14]|uniref:hypothetical protein n=1 Tax=Butyrivibrio sp. INlla14 TaxID=1520808 RepID=UPI000876975A|nr:hypothetical protein [Butyrivibrio sp. INlla14]SCX84079.1 hypothetical protein SAMN02910371_00151 [Butyrivibrio sp. INlla14]
MENMNYGKIMGTDEEVRVVQYDEGFSFDFINENKKQISITPQNDFIQTRTMSGDDLLIFKKGAFELKQGLSHYQSDIYVLGKKIKNQSCVGLKFTGGILAKLFTPNRLEIDMENGEYKIKCHDDAIDYTVMAKGKKIHLHIESHISEKQGISGKTLDNIVTSMVVSIPSGICMDEVIPLYNAVLKMCQFLAFRKNIAFDEIALLKNEEYGGHQFITEYAELHVVNRFKALTNKDWFRCISFENLGGAVVPLFAAIYDEKEKKPYFSLEFLPEDEDDVNWITPDRIKKICTCLECEAALHKITAEDNPSFQKLIYDVRQLVETHEKSSDALQPKTYDLIRGSINHWDLAAGDKIKALFHMYKEILIQPACFTGSIKSFEDSIDAFIKFRNTTTHGNYMKVTGEHADTAANLMNLIYISRLDRIGMQKSVITEKICAGVVY